MSGRDPAIAKPTDEAGATLVRPEGDVGIPETKEHGRGFLKRLDVPPEEAGSPANIRWLQYDADRLDSECVALKSEISDLRSRYEAMVTAFHDKRVELETLNGKAKVSVRNEILANLALGTGSVGIGAGASFVLVPAVHDFAVVVLVASAVLSLGGVALRIWK